MQKLVPALVMSLGLAATPTLIPLSATAKPQVAPPAAAPPAGKGRFMGAHPLTARPPAGYCYIDVPHTHDYVPDRPQLYQQVGESYVFTGDPVPFGYQGEKSVFYGHHPVPIAVEPAVAGPSQPTFCFMKGPHYHEYQPPEGPGYKTQNNVIFYVGPVPPEVARTRPQVEQALEVEYRPYVAERPKVVVTPPPEWPGVVWVAPPAPTVVVAPSAPSVVVAAPAPAVVIAPPVPSIVIAPPSPVIIGAPPPVIYMGGHGHHGKGWGKGHWKGKGGWKHW